MNGNKQYVIFGMVSGLVSCWHALTLLVILNKEPGWWVFVLVSCIIILGMKYYTKWLFKSLKKTSLLLTLSASQIIPTGIFFLIFFLKFR